MSKQEFSPAFVPVAIVGRGCILPGALNPAQLWAQVQSGRCVIEDAEVGADWRVGPWVGAQALAEATRTRAAGLVRGFSPAPADVAAVDAVLPCEGRSGETLSPMVHWLVAAGRQALAEATINLDEAAQARAGLILGNLSYPTESLSDFAHGVWLDDDSAKADPRNRFMSGLPAQLAARVLGLGAGGYCLDAACASSLYAMELACRRLARGEVDLMLAGGANHADDLFLHLGFRALQASSPTGQSRPFHRDADGLVPAHGAAVVALRRLDDALARGERVLGVIRGVGLSNDGKAGNMMAPREDGQTRAMRAAYAMSGLRPEQVSYVECHATGTPVGDQAELRSMQQVFGPARTEAGASEPLAIGSLKGNMGHLITASGAASVLKVLAAMEAGEFPVTPGLDGAPLNPELASFRVVHRAEPWTVESSRARVAAISNFGFGGNNAHLIVEQWTEGSAEPKPVATREAVAVVAQAVVASGLADESAFAARVLPEGPKEGAPVPTQVTEHPDLAAVELALGEVRTPPIDLDQTLPQQLSLLRLALDLGPTIEALPKARTGIFAGMQCDAEIARTALRYRHDLSHLGDDLPRGAGDIPAALVLGCMPNVVANRISAHFDLRGPCFSISAEQASGTVAFDVAVDKLATGELDAALVAAVDLSREPAHAAAAEALLPKSQQRPADGAVLLVLERLADAKARGAEILAVIPGDGEVEEVEPHRELSGESGASPLLGHSHAASGLLHLAAQISACRRRALPPVVGQPAVPWLPHRSRRRVRVAVESLGGLRTEMTVAADRHAAVTPVPSLERPRLLTFAASDMAGLARAVAAGERGGSGPLRLAVVGRNEANLHERLAKARAVLARPQPGPAKLAALAKLSASAEGGVYFREAPVEGELAFVFTGPAAAYPNMGRELGLLMPELVDQIGDEFASLHEYVGWIYDAAYSPTKGKAMRLPTPAQKLWASSYLIQLHARLTRQVLGMRPEAAIGYCAGESNALFAMGAWQDFESLAVDIHRCELYERELGGRMNAARRAWQLDDAQVNGHGVEWATMRVLAPIGAVRDALASEPRAHLTIVNASHDVVIAGEAGACARVIAKVGAHRARSIGYDFIMHCPEAREFEAGWHALHHRPTTTVPGVRFYTHATCTSYELSDEAVADALTGQAMGVVDFPKLIERAYADGVRVFVEHGPLSGCSKWIGAALRGREHLSVPLDRYRESSLVQICDAAAQLYVAGVELELGALTSRLEAEAPQPPAEPSRAPGKRPRKTFTYPSHWARVSVPRPSPESAMQRMLPAPALPPVTRGTVYLRGATPTPTKVAPARPQPVVKAAARAVAKPAAKTAVKPATATAKPRRSLPQNTKPAPAPVGPSFDREQLIVHARGKISTLFGEAFTPQDRHAQQVRMPCPPLLLADRVTGITGDPIDLANKQMGLGTCWTETDVKSDSWYLHDGRMPAGIFVESGQADLFLISWLGADLLNQGERVYRLLGCELTSYGPLPKPGDVLQYDIYVDGHAAHGDVRLFFFHYDCRINGEVRMSVRHGQAGFFTYDELDNSAGVLWEPSEGPPTASEAGPRMDAPAVVSPKSSFSPEDIVAFADRRPVDAFGPAFARTHTHTRTPAIAADRMRLVERVTHFEPPGRSASPGRPAGGPWARGYMRATLPLERDSWFYEGHFHEDSCMPGTLMFEGGLQAMAIYMTALGCTLERDGWRFEPVAGETWKLSCRGQAVPGAKEMVYELFIDEFIAGPQPTLFATMLGSVDGRKAFHCPRIGLRLVPDWPLEAMAPVIDAASEPAVAVTPDGFRFGYDSMLACAWGKPSRAFGSLYAPFDGGRKVPRLPGPPYHFMTRILEVEGAIGKMEVGSRVRAAYEVPRDSWYFGDSGTGAMAFSVLLEVALQPCGWLASYCGFAAAHDDELFFRNLDGKNAVIHAEVGPDIGTLVTESKLVSASSLGAMTIVAFEVAVRTSGGEALYTLSTVFGFFPAEALANQAGLPTSEAQRAALTEAGPAPKRVPATIAAHPDAGLLAGKLGVDKLATLDRISGLWPAGGEAKLGRIRAERSIDPSHWYFQAHFFQDPVQPGSIGMDAMLQALRLLALELGVGVEKGQRFEVAATEVPMLWRYRGQVVPDNRLVVVDLELTERSEQRLVAKASLWVDGKRIYEAEGLSLAVR